MTGEAALRAAGAAALAFNAPMDVARARELAAQIGGSGPLSVVDLGCGAGELLREVARAVPTARCTGIDLDGAVIDRGRRLTAAAGLADRVTLLVGDAVSWEGRADVVVCVGAAHPWGGTTAMLQGLRHRVADDGIAVVGDGVWVKPPDPWCREVFGDLAMWPGVTALAAEAGWDVRSSSLSTVAEWDDFETAWAAGVEALGTSEARAFAHRRREDQQRYRGVLGFAWLVLSPA